MCGRRFRGLGFVRLSSDAMPFAVSRHDGAAVFLFIPRLL
jgi:hypothetical protein